MSDETIFKPEMLQKLSSAEAVRSRAMAMALHHAAENGHIIRAHGLIAAGAALEARNEDGKTALMLAAEYNHTSIVRALLTAGADKEATDNEGNTALMLAAQRGETCSMQALLDAGADKNAADDTGTTVLHKAVGYPNAIRILAAAGANLEARGGDGKTALIHAADNRYGEECVYELIAAGAELDAQDNEGSTALHLARDEYATRALVLAGAALEVRNNEGKTPLLAAADNWNSGGDRVRQLLTAGADKEATDNEGKTALMLAACQGDSSALTVLLAACPALDATDNDGRTALMCAADGGKAGSIRALLAAGADKEATDKEGKTALMLVATNGDSTALAALLAACPALDATDNEGRTALMCAADSGCASAIRALLAAGADKEATDNDGKTALLLAASNYDPAALAALIEAGADINAKDNSGETALMDAAWSGRLAIIRTLIDAGADLNISNDEGETALDKAENGNEDAAASLLREAGAQNGEGRGDSEYSDSDDDSEYEDCESEDDDDDDNDSNESGSEENPLCQAARNGDVEQIKSLLADGADVNDKNEYGVTALMYAAGKGGNNAAVQALLDAGADVNARDGNSSNGATALMRASGKGDISIIKQLLDAGADVNITAGERNVMTALKFAAESGKEDAVQVLLQAGATGATNDPDKELLEQAQQGDEQALEKLLDNLTIEHVWTFAERMWRYYDIPEGESTFGSERFNRVLAAFLDKAEGGDATAQYAVGRLFYQWGYIYEDANPDAYQKRISWYQESYDWFNRAKNENAGAAYWLGIQTETELGCAADRELAARLYYQAAQGGYPNAFERLCELLEEFREEECEDFSDSDTMEYVSYLAGEGNEQALEYVIKQAENGDAGAMNVILRGILESEEEEKFLPILVNMEEAGNAEAHSILFGEDYESDYFGSFDQDGENVRMLRDALKIATEDDCDWNEESRTTVLEWLRKQAEAGVDWAADILSGAVGGATSDEG